MRATVEMLSRLLLVLFCFVAVSYCQGCGEGDGDDGRDAAELLELDARQVDEVKGPGADPMSACPGSFCRDSGEQLEHDAGPELERDAGEHDAGPVGIAGVWQVMRTRVEPASHLDVCEDATGNVRDPSASEVWTVGSKVEGSKLGVLTLQRAGSTLELARGAPLKIEGFVRLTAAAAFEGSITITGNAPTPSGDGWRTCTTTQTVRGWR